MSWRGREKSLEKSRGSAIVSFSQNCLPQMAPNLLQIKTLPNENHNCSCRIDDKE